MAERSFSTRSTWELLSGEASAVKETLRPAGGTVSWGWNSSRKKGWSGATSPGQHQPLIEFLLHWQIVNCTLAAWESDAALGILRT